MRSTTFTFALFSILASLVKAGRPIPANLQAFKQQIVGQGQCNNVLGGEHWDSGAGSGDQTYCGDHKDDYGVVYLQGMNGQLSDMDTDCDGAGATGGGQCENDPSNQPQTAFQGQIGSYNKGVSDIAAQNIPYVVLGNEGFDLASQGVEPLSVVAVLCGDQLVYGVWGDTNGFRTTGEASISLATMCFGTGMTGNSGHGEQDVLYVAFTGADAVPGADAPWDTTDPAAFEQAISALGDKLVSRIGGGSTTPQQQTGDTTVPSNPQNSTSSTDPSVQPQNGGNTNVESSTPQNGVNTNVEDPEQCDEYEDEWVPEDQQGGDQGGDNGQWQEGGDNQWQGDNQDGDNGQWQGDNQEGDQGGEGDWQGEDGGDQQWKRHFQENRVRNRARMLFA